MKEENKSIISKLIAEIRLLALSGQTESYLYGSSSNEYMCDGDINVHYHPVGKFLPVYIETYGTSNSYCYRLYQCSGKGVYDHKIVLNPDLENDDCRCVFSYEENDKHEGTMCYLEGRDWLGEYEKMVSAMNHE